jgi:hypothetical protein
MKKQLRSKCLICGRTRNRSQMEQRNVTRIDTRQRKRPTAWVCNPDCMVGKSIRGGWKQFNSNKHIQIDPLH